MVIVQHYNRKDANLSFMQNLKQTYFKNNSKFLVFPYMLSCLYPENKLQSNTSLESLWKPKIYKSLCLRFFLFFCCSVEVCDEIHIIIHSRVYIEGSQI